MKYAVEMGSGDEFDEDWFRHSNLIGGFTDTQAAWRSHKPTLIFPK
jgi:hypothetical protein